MTRLTSLGSPFWIETQGDSPVLRSQPEAGDLIYAESLLVGYRGYDRSGPEPLFCFGHGPGYTDWSYEPLALVAEAITDQQTWGAA